MENRGAAYELQDIPDLSRDRVEHGSSNAAVRRSRPRYADPYLASFEGQGDENTREQLALEIYIQASLASEWLRQKDGARGSATRSQQTRTMRTNAAWITAIGAVIAAIVASLFLFTH